MPDRIADLMAWGLSEGVARRVASRDRPVGPVRDQRSEAARLEATRDRLAQQTPTERLLAGMNWTPGPRIGAAPAPQPPTVTLASIGPAPEPTVTGRLREALTALVDDPARYNVGGVPARGSVEPLAALGFDAMQVPLAASTAALFRGEAPQQRALGTVSHVNDVLRGAVEPDAPSVWLNEGVDDPGWGRTAAGLGLDIGFDPQTYSSLGASIPFAIAKGVGKKLAKEVVTAGVTAGVKRAARTAAGAVTDDGSLALIRALEPHVGAKEIGRLRTALMRDPELQSTLQYLKPQELPTLLRSPAGLQSFKESFGQLTDPSVLRAASVLGDAKLEWYKRSRAAIEHLFGEDADLFAGVLASTSPQTSVDSNLVNTVQFFSNWKAAGRPRDAATVRQILGASVQGGSASSALPAWVPNVVNVITDNTKAISGPKVDSFWANLRSRWKVTPYGEMDPSELVVLDAWMGHTLGVPQTWFSGGKKSLAMENPGLTAKYLAGTARIRQVAADMGLSSSEAQETIWSSAYALYNKAKKLKLTPSEVLQRGLLTAEDVAGTPDFGTLLQSEKYAPLLVNDPDIAQRLATWTPPARTRAALEPGPGHDEGVRQFGAILGRTVRAREAEKALGTGAGIGRDNALLVVGQEGVGDVANTGILPSTATPAQRTSGSREILQARQDAFGQNAALSRALNGGAEGDAAVTRVRSIAKGGQWTEKLPDGSTVVVNNPLDVSGAIIPRGGAERRKLESAVRAVTDIQAANAGQSAATHVVIDTRVSPKRWNMVDISGSTGGRAIKPAEFDAFTALLPPEWIAVHKQRGLAMLKIDPQTMQPLSVSDQDVQALTNAAKSAMPQFAAKGQPVLWRVRGAENTATRGYRSIAENAPPGSGIRTTRVVGPQSDWVKQSAAWKRALDVDVKREAMAILGMVKRTKRVLHAGELNYLEIAARSGATGLARALKDPNQVLPVLAGLGVAGAMLGGVDTESP